MWYNFQQKKAACLSDVLGACCRVGRCGVCDHAVARGERVVATLVCLLYDMPISAYAIVQRIAHSFNCCGHCQLKVVVLICVMAMNVWRRCRHLAKRFN